MSDSDANSRLTRWRVRVVEDDNEFVYKMSLENRTTDALSHIPTDGEITMKSSEDILCYMCKPEAAEKCDVFCIDSSLSERKVTAVSLEELIAEQAKDPLCENMIETSLSDPKYSVHTDEN